MQLLNLSQYSNEYIYLKLDQIVDAANLVCSKREEAFSGVDQVDVRIEVTLLSAHDGSVVQRGAGKDTLHQCQVRLM